VEELIGQALMDIVVEENSSSHRRVKMDTVTVVEELIGQTLMDIVTEENSSSHRRVKMDTEQART
jgi:hypothetical protein